MDEMNRDVYKQKNEYIKILTSQLWQNNVITHYDNQPKIQLLKKLL